MAACLYASMSKRGILVRLFSCIPFACLYFCMYISQSWHIWHACRASCPPTTHPSTAPQGTREKSPPGIWNLSEMLTSTMNGCVGSIRLMVVIIIQGSRQIMTMRESYQLRESTLAYWVQSAWIGKEVSDLGEMGSENLVVPQWLCIIFFVLKK